MAHTKGPWIKVGITIKSQQRPIALVHTKSLPPDAECISNAHLIAVSPQLLKVCQESIGTMWTAVRNAELKHFPVDVIAELRARALRMDAAIKAALGEEGGSG